MWRWFIIFLSLGSTAQAVECEETTFENADYTVCRVDTAREDLRLFLNDPETDVPLASFKNVETLAKRSDKVLLFAMNAGMYHQDRRPVGHYVEDSKASAPLIKSEGPGNFGLLPNGVFCVSDYRADVFETLRFDREAPSCAYATQSGPMLVIDGVVHPKFLENSDSLFVRNGVGTSQDGKTTWFAISEGPVNFYRFARLFRDHLQTPQALYFDGNISRLFAPSIGRHDGGFPMGPIVGVVSEK